LYTLTNIEVISAKAPAISTDVRRQAVVLSILLLAAILRIYAISLYPLTGDEYSSLAEAKLVGLNLNSIIYSGLMHFWIRLGSSELWLRLPAAILGIATVVILFKLGEKLGGWRTGVVAGLLAATSPFNIYHSQEVRFYAFFMCAAAAFMLATVHYVDARRTWRTYAALLLTGVTLFFSHFIGPLALYVQGAVTASVGKSKSRKRTLLIVLVGLPIVICALLLTPGLHHQLWRLYQAYGYAPSSFEPVMTPVSILNLAKATFAGFIFTFGYHVYPLRLLFVVAGIALSGFLLLSGVRRMWQGTLWGVLPFAYLLALIGIYVVLDAAGGRLAAGVSPRHVAFVWPMFLVLMAIGATSFKKPLLYLLVAAVLTLNALSIWSGWEKEWIYGAATDSREAAASASKWVTEKTAILHDTRSKAEIDFYFPQGIPLINSWAYLQNPDLTRQLHAQRLIFVTDDWDLDRRRGLDQLIGRLNEEYSVIDGRVDYPLFEYALERKSLESTAYDLRAGSNQLLQPISFYGLEFQDLRLPVSVRVKDVPLQVIGAYSLPDFEGRRELNLPLSVPVNSRRVIIISDIVGAGALPSSQPVAEILVESKDGKTLTLPIRLGKETTAWDKQCEATAPCRTIFQWDKRIAITGQNSYAGALRDFSAGLHGVALDLPEQQEVVKLTIRYTASTGQLYVWGIALPSN